MFCWYPTYSTLLMLGNSYLTQLPQVPNYRVFEKEGHTISNWSKMQYQVQFCTSVIVKWWTIIHVQHFREKYTYTAISLLMVVPILCVLPFWTKHTYGHIKLKWPKCVTLIHLLLHGNWTCSEHEHFFLPWHMSRNVL